VQFYLNTFSLATMSRREIVYRRPQRGYIVYPPDIDRYGQRVHSTLRDPTIGDIDIFGQRMQSTTLRDDAIGDIDMYKTSHAVEDVTG
jgi:hypothetical protein